MLKSINEIFNLMSVVIKNCHTICILSVIQLIFLLTPTSLELSTKKKLTSNITSFIIFHYVMPTKKNINIKARGC